ncbi:hypothetical protein GCM10011611_09970 [Aliidongia dinghuensis]|uniref:Efflux RND transporter periplasmic adaptor subunit n=2 Tax=Aliidongia dinghuensis TaxID=1867774 RepID=A0A8J2YRW6_9PROT|nr:hypothetical protein GCM10011611_09970 [Aliidongia dinghuensis]
MSGPGPARAADPPAAPALVHDHDRIVVPEGSPYRKRLFVEAAATQQLQRALEVPATVEADPALTVKVLPPLSGRIVDLKVSLGDHVSQGQAIAVIESPDLAQAYDDDAKAQSALELTKKAYDRQRGVTGIGAGADKDLETARDAYNQANAEYQRTQARLKTIGQFVDLKDKSRLLTIRAPMSGDVTELDIARRGYINDPTQSLMTISQLDTVWVTANVPEKDIGVVKKGEQATIKFAAYPTETFQGNVQFVSAVLEPDTRRSKVRIAFANPSGRFKPNMFATATFMRAEIPQLVLPTSALLMNNDNTTVFVEVAPWTFVRRTVELEYQTGDAVTIVNGVALGERVLIKGGVLLND